MDEDARSNNVQAAGPTEKHTEVQNKSEKDSQMSMIRISEPQNVLKEVLKLKEEKAKELGNGRHLEGLRQKPKLALFVIGDSGSFVPKQWRTLVLHLGLIETAKGAKDCLIMYKVSNKQISTLVKYAVESFHSLYEDDCDNFIGLVGLMPESHSKPEEQRKKNKEDEYWKTSKCVFEAIFQLKPDTNLESEVYPKFYARILEAISNEWTDLINLEKELEIRIPVLTIVAGGDLETINTVNEILQKGLPVLILKGSGNAADFIADFTESHITVENFIAEQTDLLFGINSQGNRKLLENMDGIKTNTSLITVMDIEKQTKGTDFTDAVARAIIRGWSNGRRKERTDIFDGVGKQKRYVVREKSDDLKSVILDVNGKSGQKDEKNVDNYHKYRNPASLPLYYYMAYQFIQEIDGYINYNDKKENFESLLREAIIADRVDYVSVLLDNGVKFKPSHFSDIYKRALPLDISENLSEDSIKTDRNRMRMRCQVLLGYPKPPEENTEDDNENVYEDLLIWAVFANRPKLATLFWTRSKHQLLGALFVSCIFKNMASKVKSVRYLSPNDNMLKQSRKFAEKAINQLSKSFAVNQQETMELVNTEETLWGITICPLEFAYENYMLDFISHICCHRRLNEIWYNEISETLWGFWKQGFLSGCCCLSQSRIKHETRKKEMKCTDFILAPLTRFLVHYAFFLAALVCFSAFILSELDVYKGWQSVHVYEWIVYIYFYGDLLEEYRNWYRRKVEVVVKPSSSSKQGYKLCHSRWYRFKTYIYNFWNILDVLSYILLIMATLIRVFKPSSTSNLARRFYSFSLFVMYMRFLRVLLVSRKLGPKLIMIKEMLKDLVRFISILFVFMIGVGVLYHALMYPKHEDMWNQKGWEYWRIWKIIQIPYWQMYGESFLETFQGNTNTPCTTVQSEWESNPDIERCNKYDWVVIFIGGIYMLISNLLLVNLVIALFSYRFEKVQEISGKLWIYLRYGVIMEFHTRIPTPLNLIIRPLMLLVAICKKCKKAEPQSHPDKKSIRKKECQQSTHARQFADEESEA